MLLLSISFLLFLGLGLFEKDFLDALRAYKPKSIDLNLMKSDETKPRGKLISKFAVLADTHSDGTNTKKALESAKALGVDQVLVGGDLTTVGTVAELNEQKEIFDQAQIPYSATLGDHDLWQSGTRNFQQVFGPRYKSFDKKGIHYILIDSSDTDIGFGKEQLNWLKIDLEKNKGKITFILMHLPVYHPYNSRTISEKGGTNSAVASQVKDFLSLIKGKVNGIFAGDHHFSSSYTEPASGVRINVVGAVTSSRNLQEPRFDLVEVYDSGDFVVKEQVIK